VYELVLGSTLRELVEGAAGARNIKVIQVGGATGRAVPFSMIETPLSFETILGAGAVTVFDESRDVLEIVQKTLEFLVEESCGKCVPCREGTTAMVAIINKIIKGKGVRGDILNLEELSRTLMLSSLCGLGQGAPNQVMDTLQHFRADYECKLVEKGRLK
jgi:NADH-quinone oxidoreductase subunit F/NADP-reducing hydrogenase subunit HndC